jgi:hypothetical protein
MSQHDVDKMGLEIDGWIRHLVSNKARFGDAQMLSHVKVGRISEIRQRAEDIATGLVSSASDWDKTMAPIIVDAIDTQKAIYTQTRDKLRKARVNNMRNSGAYLDRASLDEQAS